MLRKEEEGQEKERQGRAKKKKNSSQEYQETRIKLCITAPSKSHVVLVTETKLTHQNMQLHARTHTHNLIILPQSAALFK